MLLRDDTAMDDKLKHRFLVHVPLTYTSHKDIGMPSVQVIAQRPIAIVVPFACYFDGLQAFFEKFAPVWKHVEGSKRIIVAWAQCTDLKVTQPPVKDDMELLAASSPDIQVLTVDAPFSRSLKLHTAFKFLDPEELGVVLDIDMVVLPQYFEHARAFAAPHQSVYFPITFSRFNPHMIDAWATFLERSKPARSRGVRNALAHGKVTSETGIWLWMQSHRAILRVLT